MNALTKRETISTLCNHCRAEQTMVWQPLLSINQWCVWETAAPGNPAPTGQHYKRMYTTWVTISSFLLCLLVLSTIDLQGILPALAGLCGRPGDTVFLWSCGCCGDSRRGSVRVEVTKEVVTRLLGLLNGRGLWLDTGTVTGMEKVGGGTVDWESTDKEGNG